MQIVIIHWWNVYSVCSGCGDKEGADTAGTKHTATVTKTETKYTCGAYTNKWKIGCGKTENSVETATIVFN